jgi:hypothetical protein
MPFSKKLQNLLAKKSFNKKENLELLSDAPVAQMPTGDSN